MGADDLEYHKEDYDYEKLSLADKCLVHRYLIYAAKHPMLSSDEYYTLLARAVTSADTDQSHKIHATYDYEVKENYPVEIRTIATELMHQRK